MVLALQYFLVLYQTRHHNRARRSLTLAVALHLVPAIFYLILAMVSYANQSKELMYAWYGIGGIELIAILIQATMSKTLSFLGTHFSERLNLLTLIIIGEGSLMSEPWFISGARKLINTLDRHYHPAKERHQNR
jgi:low temperature requirement protein LtrA